jgi:hypothetical protein
MPMTNADKGHCCETDICLEILIPLLDMVICNGLIKRNGMSWKINSAIYIKTCSRICSDVVVKTVQGLLTIIVGCVLRGDKEK